MKTTIIREGETLGMLSARLGVPGCMILRANGLFSEAWLLPGRHIDVPDALPQYPEVREFVNIKSLLSEADRKLLAETECDEAESLLERIENEGYCHVRARCWTPDEESGGWMCVLSVDV